MNKQNLNKTLAAGIFAATIITITACGGGGGGGSLAPASTKISTIAGGGDSATTTDPTQAILGTFGTFSNLVVREGNFYFNSNRDGTVKLQYLDLATNILAPANFSNIGSGETLSHLLAASADKYYFLTSKNIGSSGAVALYEAGSTLVGTHIAGKNDATSSEFLVNTSGLLASLRDPSSQAVFYNDGTTNQLLFADSDLIRKVALSGTYAVSTVNADSTYSALEFALMGDKLIVTDLFNSLIFEHDLKTGKEKVVAGIRTAYGYENAENPLLAKFNSPTSIIISPSGNIYFTVRGVKTSTEDQKIIRKLEVKNGVYGAVTTAFGAAPDSKADNADITNIIDLEFIGNNLYVLDSGADSKYRIKKIEFINQTP